MAQTPRGTRAIVAAASLGLCIIVCAIFLILVSLIQSPLKRKQGGRYESQPQLRRSLMWSKHHDQRPPMNPVVREHIKPLTTKPDPSTETVLFWHIAKSGGTTVKAIYKCMNRVLTVRVGADPKWGHDKDKELVVFEPGHQGALFVNVDTLSQPGILRAEELGLVPSGLADMIVTPNPNFAIEHLFDKFHKGRAMALFRHPVERLVSKFYYTQIATWERSYRPELANMDLLQWAETLNRERNPLVKSLAGLKEKEAVQEEDYNIALRTVSQRFIVGLTDQMEESIHRFNIFMGIDEADATNRECMDEFFGHGEKKSNSNHHPKVDKRHPAWQVLAKDNEFDVRLFNELAQLFDEQRVIIMSHASGVR